MIRVYNTLSKTKEPLQPVTPGKVGIYLCGPTVYKEAHVGHMVGPVIFDCIKRYLTYCGYQVTWVVNITDVDDKLIVESNRRGISMAEVAEEMTGDYLHNLAAFGVDQIDHMPKATEHLGEIIRLIGTLVEKGYAYASDGDVYFEVGKDPQYGKLSNRTAESLQGEGGEAAARKRALGDFALWKGAKPGEPAWDSPWGRGRPGWHVECSAMSRRLLGETFDIHGGGLDLVFPHHENEIAQSECCHGKPMATLWMHNGLMKAAADAGKVGGRGQRDAGQDSGPADAVQADAESKISRSKGAGGLAELVARQGGERIRFFLLRTHYRSTIVFSEAAIEQAAAGLETFYRFFKRYQRISGEDFYAIDAAVRREDGEFDPGGDATLAAVHQQRAKFLAAMDDDFNTGGAVGDLFELVHTLNRHAESENLEGDGREDAAKLAVLRQGTRTLRELASTMGLFLAPPPSADAADAVLDGLARLLAALRDGARREKNFALADRIRDATGPLGITFEDRPGGTAWSIASPGDDTLAGLMKLVLQLRADARRDKQFAVADTIRDGLAPLGITLEDRPGGTDWSRT